MFFKRKSSENQPETGQAGQLSDWTTIEDKKLEHGAYVIIPCVKRLLNGKWVVRLSFETEREGGAQRYDFPGPMREYEDQDSACKSGLRFALRRIQSLSEIRPAKADFE